MQPKSTHLTTLSATEFSLPKLEHNIASKQSPMITM